jgi:hypothetical protein
MEAQVAAKSAMHIRGAARGIWRCHDLHNTWFGAVGGVGAWVWGAGGGGGAELPGDQQGTPVG